MKRSSTLLLAACGLLAAFVPKDAGATVLVTTNDLAPTSYFATSTERAGGVQWRNSTSAGLRDLGQSFYVENDLLLDSITFRLAPDAAPGAGALTAAFDIAIYEIATAGSVPSSAPFFTDSGTMAGLTGTPADFSKYVTFDLNDVALQGGKYYAFILSFPTQAVERQITFQVSGAAPTYTGGMAIISLDGTTFSGWGGGSDLVFYVTAVPEPAVTTLVLCGAGMMTLRFRRRRP